MVIWATTMIVFCCLFNDIHASLLTVDYNSSNDVKKLPRFWMNTGFAPPEPLDKVADFLESDDVNLNLEIIGSLPNNGIKNVRIHWLLNLLTISGYDALTPVYNFEKLDTFLDKIIYEYELLPTIEFMTTLAFDTKNLSSILWQNLAFQITSRYLDRYGANAVSKWKFETWNEPDLRSYNYFNFTKQEYFDYIHGIKEGLKAANRQYPNATLELRGPAGNYKDPQNHPFCWGVLEKCNENLSSCPIDIITFHRKGNGNDANEIINGSLELIGEFSRKYPNLYDMQYSNTEADPIKKWSEARDFQSDTRYAAILVETILQHWKAIFDGRMKNLDSISHDNSFLNFYPHVFTQRTLLARFQMNNTTPKHVQFIEKPVYSALGLSSYLGAFASSLMMVKNFSYVVSRNKNQTKYFYSCILLTSHVNLNEFKNKTKNYEIRIMNLPKKRNDLFYFVEGLDNKRTNPSKIYERIGKPAYPETRFFTEMRKSQTPMIIEEPQKIIEGKIFINARLMEPFVIAVRICSSNVKIPKRVFNLRLRKINSQEIILFWSDKNYQKRCIKTYEIFFQYQTNYFKVETGHIPFLHFQLKHTIPGCFKVRSMDFFNRFSKFSERICLK